MHRYEALQHAIKAHGPETDWCGKLYIFHPMAVADRIEKHWRALDGVNGFGLLPDPLDGGVLSVESGIIVALLHDVLEDTDYELRDVGLTPRQAAALDCVTRWPTETYREYIEKAAADPLATIVKLADLSHNMSDERKENLDESQLARAEGLEAGRYIPSRDRLWEALGQEWWPA
jgi:(p)ppGpp synthase/HD superfamily hydrolase